MILRVLRPRRRGERGAVAIIFAVAVSALAVVAALVLDFGMVRVDRQIDRSAADSATLAGLHALNRDDGISHSYPGVCAAIRYLQANYDRFSSINENTGWTDGLGAATGNGCNSTALRNKTCKATDKSTWAKWTWSGTFSGASFNVTIESGFLFTGSTRPEDALAASSPDTSLAGCDTLAVTISQSREAGLGKVIGAGDLSTSIRSVGRVKNAPGDSAPAMLLLKRTGCPVLRAGNSGSGSGTYIHVLGAITTTGVSMPGTIHADSDGVGCTGGSNSNIFIGAQNDAIVAYAAPTVGNPTVPDPARPGLITSVAAANEAAASVVRDQLNYVYGSSALSSGGTKNEVSGRTLITRKIADERYFTGVKAALSDAAAVWSTASTSFNRTLNSCNPTQATITAMNLLVTDRLYVNCSTPAGFTGDNAGLTINAGTIFFRSNVNPTGTLRMPNATKVYIQNSGDRTNGISLSNGTSFEMNNATANLSGGNCNQAVSTTMTKATLFVRSGSFAMSGGTLRLCRTTMFLMGGQNDGCVPATIGTAPTATPCTSAMGSGQMTQTGGDIDWSAPNTLDATLDFTTKTSLPAAIPAWEDKSGPEDLALWAESGSSTSATYNMAGGGLFNVRGVFFIPNADPFRLSGGSALNLTNAQYITSSIELNGGTQITMKVDPNSAIILPDLDVVGLIR